MSSNTAPYRFNNIASFGLTNRTPVTFGDFLSQGATGVPSPTVPAVPTVTPVSTNMGVSNDLTPKIKPWEDKNWFGKMMWNQDGTFNWQGLGALTKTLGGLGQLYLGIQANKTAKDSLNFQKQSYAENLANQIKSYNLALEDRVRARAVQKEQSSADAESYINKHKL